MDSEERAFQELYGRWEPLDPQQMAAVMGGAGLDWWVVGGWAARVGGEQRAHDDIDVAIVRSDLPRLAAHLADWHLWEVGDGSLRPLRSDVPDGVEQLWARRDADHPWQFDVLLHPDATEWIFKKDSRIRLPWDRALWEIDGIRYLRPEIALLHKAHLDRPKDREDLASASLDPSAREWLAHALVTYGHSDWLEHAVPKRSPSGPR